MPSLKLGDTAAWFTALMAEFYVKQLPVVENDKYIRGWFEEDLLNIDTLFELSALSAHFSKVSVHAICIL